MAEDTQKIKALVVGSGAREHALAWKLDQSPLVSRVFVAPGNPGMDFWTTLVPIKSDDYDGIVKFAQEENIGLVAVGPEVPLAAGLADRLKKAGIPVFGPNQAAAQLESSKAFAKDFMRRHQIPTAAWQTFTKVADARQYLNDKEDGPVVVKASGLAQGKGVVVAANRAEALAAVNDAMEGNSFGEAGNEVVIEDFIDGEEVTILSFCDGKSISPMLPVQDHKRIGEGDTGLNTGGMGAYAPVSAYTSEVARQVEENIITPTLNGLKADGLDFCGCLYFGLILPSSESTYQGPQVIEYNVRFGDPEAEVLMPLLKSDLAEIMLKCIDGKLADSPVQWRDESAVCVVLASGGYPADYKTGLVITEDVSSVAGTSIAFHGGTALNESGEIVTAGGRVMAVTAKDLTLENALRKVYDRLSCIHFKGSYYRGDIAKRELARRQK